MCDDVKTSWLKLHELAGQDVSASYVERAAEALGREVAEGTTKKHLPMSPSPSTARAPT